MREPRYLEDGDDGFRVETPLRSGDVGRMGHVRSECFSTYCYEGYLAFFAAVGVDSRRLILARLECDHRGSTFVERGPLEQAVRVERVGRSSIALAHVLRQRGAVVAAARTVHVAFDYARDASRPLTAAERDALAGAPG